MRRVITILLVVVIAVLATGAFLRLEKHRTQHPLILYGNVDVRQVDLGFRVSGRVNFMPFQEGNLVPEGALIATLDKQPYLDQVRQAEAALASAQASLSNAQRLLQRRQELLSDGSVSQEDYENALSSRDVLEADVQQAEATLGVAVTHLKDTAIYSPSAGTILTRIREPGTVVREADPIYTLSLTSPVWIRAYASEPELGLIYPGMKAEIRTDTKGGPIYSGHIGFISPTAEFTPKTVETTQLRTDLVYRLRVIADNPDQGLRQGMPVTVVLPLQDRGNEKSP